MSTQNLTNDIPEEEKAGLLKKKIEQIQKKGGERKVRTIEDIIEETGGYLEYGNEKKIKKVKIIPSLITKNQDETLTSPEVPPGQRDALLILLNNVYDDSGELKNKIITDTTDKTDGIVFICYILKKDKLDFGVLQFYPFGKKEQVKLKSSKNKETDLFRFDGDSKYTIFDGDGKELYKQFGHYTNNDDFTHITTKSEEGNLLSFFSICYSNTLLKKNTSISYYVGTFTSDLGSRESACAITLVERQQNLTIAVEKIGRYFRNEQSVPSEIVYYLQGKRLQTETQNALTGNLESLPTYSHLQKLKEISGIYSGYFINTRENAVEKVLFIINADGRVVQKEERSERTAIIRVLENDLLYCKLDYIKSSRERTKFVSPDSYRAHIFFKERHSEDNNLYLQGVMSGVARRFAKPILSRIILKYIGNIEQKALLSDKNNLPAIYKFKDKNFSDFIDAEPKLFRFLWGFEEEKSNNDMGVFGESLNYFNKISKKNFLVKRVNHIFDSLSDDKKNILTKAEWMVYFYLKYEVEINGETFINEGIAYGKCQFHDDGKISLSIPGKNNLDNEHEIYEGFIYNEDKEIFFLEFYNKENDIQINIEFHIYAGQLEGIGIYTRIEHDIVISGFILMESYSNKKANIDLRNKIGFIGRYSNEIAKIDKDISNFIFKHTKNAISIKPLQNFREYRGPNNTKKIVRPNKIYLTSPATFNQSEQIFDEIKKDINKIKEKLKSVGETKYGKGFKVFCAFDKYHTFKSINDSNTADIYVNIKEEMMKSNCLVMIYHKSLGENIGQSFMLVEFGWASILGIPIHIFQMEGTNLPNLIQGIAGDRNVNIYLEGNKNKKFKKIEDIVNYISENSMFI